MPESIQEAMTVIVRADENYIDFAFGQIAKKYGSTDLYLEKALGLTAAKRQKLKKIMSY
jgi:protein-tyrosine phosphatase